MGFAKRVLILAVAVAVVGTTESADAQLRLPFRKKNADKETGLELRIQDGPWLILCTSFTGDDAEQKARMLCNELRQHRLKPYLYRQTFDYTQPTTGLGWQQPDSLKEESIASEQMNSVASDDVQPLPVRMKFANLNKIHEVAVLVGDFSADDDSRAEKTLEKIKSLNVSSLGGNQSKPNTLPSNLEKSKGGPLRTAMLVTNPLLPDEYFKRNQIDDFVIKMNKNVEYSLLKCKGLYSVKIASFRGDSTIDPNKIKEGITELQSLQQKGRSLVSSRLIEAEEKAHQLTEILRSKGIEAYEFHDRNESYVCIGSFDWVTRKSNDAILNNPEIVRVVNLCTPEVKNLPGAPNARIPKLIGGIALHPEPTPILVPKAENFTRLSGRLNLRR